MKQAVFFFVLAGVNVFGAVLGKGGLLAAAQWGVAVIFFGCGIVTAIEHMKDSPHPQPHSRPDDATGDRRE